MPGDMTKPLPPLDETTLQDITGLNARLHRLVGQYATKENLGFAIDHNEMVLTAGPTGPSVA